MAHHASNLAHIALAASFSVALLACSDDAAPQNTNANTTSINNATTSTNNTTTPTNNATTSTNNTSTGTNNASTSTNNATTSTNNATTSTNNASTGTNNSTTTPGEPILDGFEPNTLPMEERALIPLEPVALRGGTLCGSQSRELFGDEGSGVGWYCAQVDAPDAIWRLEGGDDPFLRVGVPYADVLEQVAIDGAGDVYHFTRGADGEGEQRLVKRAGADGSTLWSAALDTQDAPQECGVAIAFGSYAVTSCIGRGDDGIFAHVFDLSDGQRVETFDGLLILATAESSAGLYAYTASGDTSDLTIEIVRYDGAFNATLVGLPDGVATAGLQRRAFGAFEPGYLLQTGVAKSATGDVGFASIGSDGALIHAFEAFGVPDNYSGNTVVSTRAVAGVNHWALIEAGGRTIDAGLRIFDGTGSAEPVVSIDGLAGALAHTGDDRWLLARSTACPEDVCGVALTDKGGVVWVDTDGTVLGGATFADVDKGRYVTGRILVDLDNATVAIANGFYPDPEDRNRSATAIYTWGGE